MARDQGLGLSPSPIAAQTNPYSNSNTICTTYMLSNAQWRAGWQLLAKSFPYPEVAGSTPANDKLLNQTTSDTWRPRIGPRVIIPLATKRTRVKLSYANCLPIRIFHIITLHQRTVVRPCHVSLYGLYSQCPFFACLPFRTYCDISRS
jgi:hypothetical protein